MLLSQDIRRIVGKELTIFFSSPMAYLFLAAFSAITLFVFFWVEAFFVRNISDVRPLFEWMPILLIFISSTLTMRLWSEEKRSGTIEHILTQPVGIFHFVWAKYLACLLLLFLALLMTLPVPISVSFMGDLDWGPVLSGYVASFFLGAAYISIGLFISARSDNQIISLITSVAICGILFILGSSTITGLFDSFIGDFLRFIGTGSRFDAITRGIIDIRDLYYYASLAGVGLIFNVYVLEKSRWSKIGGVKTHWAKHFSTILMVGNLLIANVWLNQVNQVRYDTTEGKIYSISDTTKRQLVQLQEPLLIRGYFSVQTHPLLAPLVPQIKDLLREYEVAGRGLIRLELIDPAEEPELEDEANNKYAIRPTPFQIADRYQTSVVNSYFDILLQYGDEYKTLGFRDLIEIKQQKEADIEVLLRNPEYDLTSSIRKILQSYQSEGNIFSGVKEDIRFVGYISADDKLPQQLVDFRKTMQTVLDDLNNQSNGQLKISIQDPDENDGALGKQISKDFGFKPMVASLSSENSFYYYMILIYGQEAVQIPLDDLQEGSLSNSIQSAIKRFSSGFTKTVGVFQKQPTPIPGTLQQPRPEYQQLVTALVDELNVNNINLTSGRIDGEVDVLVLLGNSDFDDASLFAIDQYLMRGGTVIIATSKYEAQLSNQSLSLNDNNSQLIDWLSFNGLKLEDTLVMDEQSAPFPVPVTRRMGNLRFQEIKLLKYPYFSDIRGEGLNSQNSISNSLSRVVMAWASPITIDSELSSSHKVVEILKTSKRSWQSNSKNVLPKMNKDGSSGFAVSSDQQPYTVGVSVQGRFNSWFADKQSPLVGESASTSNDSISQIVSKSPESSRIILYSSADFIKDTIMQLIGSANRNNYRDSVELMRNTIEFSIDGTGLQDIRARSNFNRTLPPIEVSNQQFIEYGNYIIAMLLLVLIAIIRKVLFRRRLQNYINSIEA